MVLVFILEEFLHKPTAPNSIWCCIRAGSGHGLTCLPGPILGGQIWGARFGLPASLWGARFGLPASISAWTAHRIYKLAKTGWWCIRTAIFEVTFGLEPGDPSKCNSFWASKWPPQPKTIYTTNPYTPPMDRFIDL